MDATTVALAAKVARSEIRKLWNPDFQGRTAIDGINGKDGRDGRDGKDGKQGPQGLAGKDGKNGKDGERGKPGADGRRGERGEAGTNGRDGKDGSDGVDGNRWHLVQGEPDADFGGEGDFALDALTSNVYHKADEWEFVVHLKAESQQGMQFMAPRAYSESKIQDITMDNYTDIEYLADQPGAGGVLTFTFSSDVDLIVVELVEDAADDDAGAIEGRATTGTQTPTASLGAVLKHECPIPLQVTTDTCKVYAPSACTITVYGKRR